MHTNTTVTFDKSAHEPSFRHKPVRNIAYGQWSTKNEYSSTQSSFDADYRVLASVCKHHTRKDQPHDKLDLMPHSATGVLAHLTDGLCSSKKRMSTAGLLDVADA